MWPELEDDDEYAVSSASSARTITEKRWEGYGLSAESMARYKCHDITKAEATQLGFANASDGIYIPYPRDEDSRIRWKPSGFAVQVEGGKYGQRSSTLPALYVPPSVTPEWQNMTTVPVLITEGEFKAMVVDRLVNHREGTDVLEIVPCAVGGVFNWGSNKNGILLIDDLKDVSWLGRMVYIAYDTDSVSNANVSLALIRLSNALASKGAIVRTLQWSADEGKGIDDYLCGSSIGYDAWLMLLNNAQFPSHVHQVIEMNSRFVYCEVQQQIFDSNNMTYITPRSFGSDFFTTQVKVQTGVKNKVAVMKDIPIGQYWMSSPHRAACVEPCFRPGAPRMIEVHERRYLNTWSGWGQGLRSKPLTPAQGVVKPFYDFLYATFGGEKKEHVEYLVKRLAWMFQQPEKKHPTWIYLMGRPLQGKSTLIKIVSSLVGLKYTANVDESIVKGQFAEWRSEKLLVTFDDSSISDSRVIRQLLKRLTTEESSQVNLKYVKAQTTENYFSFIFATNSVDALLDHDDRRALVLEADCKWNFSEGEWAEFDNWRGQKESMQALLHHFLYEVKVDSDFYTEVPPKTNARELVIEVGESSWDDMVNYLAMAKGHIQWPLPASDGVRKWRPTIFTIDMIRNMFYLRNGDTEKFKITSATLVGKLVRYGARRCNPGGTTDTRKRLFINDEQVTFWTWDYSWMTRDRESYIFEYNSCKRDFPELFPARHSSKF